MGAFFSAPALLARGSDACLVAAALDTALEHEAHAKLSADLLRGYRLVFVGKCRRGVVDEYVPAFAEKISRQVGSQPVSRP
jgi:hypothetical protein